MDTRGKTPEIEPVTGGVLLFRSCLISTEYPGAEAATKWLFERFGIEYTVHPEQTCCTGLGYYSELVPVATSVALAARNACVAVDERPPGHELPLLDLLRHQQEGAQHPAGPGVPGRDEPGAGEGRPRVHRRRGGRHPPQPHDGGPLERSRLHPRPHPAAPRRHQGRHAPRLPLLQGLPGRGRGRQRGLHDPGGPARGHGRHQDGPLQREDDALRRGLPPALRQPLHRGRRDSREAATPGAGGGRRAACTCAPTAPSSSTGTTTSSRRSSQEEYPFVHLHVQQLLALALGRRPREGLRARLAFAGRRTAARTHRCADAGRA